MSGFTPGPWKASAYIVYAGNHRIATIADVTVRGCADAALCAAAPDLFAACERLVSSVTQATPNGNVYALGELHDAVAKARAAIEKAAN